MASARERTAGSDVPATRCNVRERYHDISQSHTNAGGAHSRPAKSHHFSDKPREGGSETTLTAAEHKLDRALRQLTADAAA
jgi:hypothetical protein